MAIPPPLPLAPDPGTREDPYYVLGDVVNDGRILGAYWTGSEEAVVLIDPTTMEANPVGTLGDLYWWQGQLLYDQEREIVYALGETARNELRVYTMPLATGVTTSAHQTDRIMVGGVVPDGRIVGAYWGGSDEEVVLLDPETGDLAPVGALGDLYLWQGQLVYDAAADSVHALGQTLRDELRVYTLPLDASAPASSVPVEQRFVAGDVMAHGGIVGAYWTGEVERVVAIDPLTGATETLGDLGSLYMWGGEVLVDPHRATLWARGEDRDGTEHLYRLPL